MLKIITNREELLAMPENSYMDESQLDFFEKYINSEINELYKRVSILKSEIQDLNESGTAETIDIANSLNELSIKVETVNQSGNKIKALESALRKIKDGNYGYCAYSGEEIGLKRLLVNPSIELSVEEQDRKEKLEKQIGKFTN